MGSIRISTLIFIIWTCVVSAQYNNRPMSFQPIPVILQIPNTDQQIPANLRYSVINEDVANSDRSRNHLSEINTHNPSHRRNDASQELPNTYVRFADEKPKSNHFGYENGYHSRRPGRISRGWQASYPDQRSHRRSSHSRMPRKEFYPRNFREENTVAEFRTPRIVKYIADKNGVAIREDLYKPLQETISRSRQRGILTVAGSAPQMAQVVTSAIKVSNGHSSSGGKYIPQIEDLKV